ncbi:MAG TPA: phage virion morphogenesis protein [Solirubrobacterales bacterium]|nr:phage virion morphogenesis protein [Solirubrobacterales bacterium]
MSPFTNGAGLGIEVDMQGLSASVAMLREIAERGLDMRPALEEVKEVLVEGNKRQFSSHGSYLGEPWPPLSPETQARKAREGVPSLMDILVSGGDLQASIAGGKGRVARVTRSSVRVGTKLFKGRFAQSGASGGRRGAEPKRSIIGIGEAEHTASERILVSYLTGRGR